MLSPSLSRAAVAHFLLATLLLGLVPPPPASAGPSIPQELVSAAELERSSPILKSAGLHRAATPPERSERPLTARALPGGPPPPKAPDTASPDAVRGRSLLRGADAPPPEPGIRRTPLAKERMLYQEVEPPRSPFDLVKHFPNEYLPPGVAFPPPGSRPAAKLRVRPSELRFALTPGGPLPVEQTLEVTSDSRRGVGFELVELPDWLAAGHRRGRASFDASVIALSVLERRVGEALTGEVVLRNTDDPEDVLRVPVHLAAFGPGEPIEPLRSYDEDGRLERLVRADGTVIDYEYDGYGQLTRVRYPDGTSVGYTYDDAGRRTSMVDGQGTTVYRYDELGRLAAVYSPGFDPVRYKWDDEDRLTALTYPHGRVVSYGYDEAGRLASVHEDAGTTVYRYGEDGRLLGQTLPNGIATEYGYDAGGRIVEVAHKNAGGELVLGFRYELDEDGRTTRTERETPDGVEVTGYVYDEAGRVTWADYPGGRSVSYEYDDLGNRLRTTEIRGADLVVTDYYYDEAGRLVQVGDETLEYDVHGNVVMRRSPGRTLEYGYDFDNRLVSFRDDEHEVFYGYDGDGRRSVESVDGETVRRGYDSSGVFGEALFDADTDGRIRRSYGYGLDRLSQSNLEGEPTLLLYDRPTRNVAAIGALSGEVVGPFAYDVFGVPVKPREEVSFLLGASPYDPTTGLLEVHGRDFDPAIGRYLTTEEPPVYRLPHGDGSRHPSATLSDRLAQVTGLSGGLPSAETPHEELSQSGPTDVVVFQSNQLPPASLSQRSEPGQMPFPKLTQFERGRSYRRPLIEKTLPALSLKPHPSYLVFAETASGLLPGSQTLEISTTTGDLLTFTLTEDLPWLSLSSTGGSAGSEPAVIVVSVDSTGLDPANGPYTGSLLLENSADSSDTHRIWVKLILLGEHAMPKLFSFNPFGLPQRVIRPDGSVADYRYDARGRLVGVAYLTGGAVQYEYDANGNRIRMTDHQGDTFYVYDNFNRLVAVFSPGLNPIEYEYDLAGHIKAITYPDLTSVTYTHDGDGRILSATSDGATVSYEYEPATGLLTRETLPSGTTADYGYDSDGNLTGVTYQDSLGQLVEAHRYTYNGNSQRTSYVRETAGGPQTTSYEYDPLLRLQRVTYPDGLVVEYGYDPMGNRLTKTVNDAGDVSVLTYRYDDDHRLVQVGDELFQYDANGRLVRRIVADKIVAYEYDFNDRLVRVDDGEEVRFVYDGDGRRIEKIYGTSHVRYVNDFNRVPSRVLIEADANYLVTKRYFYSDRRVAFSEPGDVLHLYHYSDPRKSVSAVEVNGGGLVETYDYEAFGVRRGPGPNLSPYGFNAEQLDSETGLIYLRSRYYDPTLGRFLTRDPFSGSQYAVPSFNPYAFVQNDPVNNVDRDGEIANFLIGAGLGLLSQYVQDVALNVIEGRNNSLGEIFTPTSSWESYAASAAIGAATSGLGVATRFAGGAARLTGLQATSRTASFIGGLAEGTLSGAASNSLQQGLELLTGTRQDPFSFKETLISAGTSAISGGLSNGIFPGDSFGQIAGNFAVGNAADIGFASVNPADLGGVSLNKTATLLLQIDDIAGATYDEATGQLVLFGQEDVALPEMDFNDMAVAVNSVFSGEDPGVSIDPPIVNGQMSVRYEGETAETDFGWIMFESDRVLKILSLGKDNLTGQPVGSNVPGYKSMLQRRIEVGCSSLPDSTRMWFQPKDVRLVRSADGQTMLFDVVSMELLYESKVGDQVVSDPQAAAFAAHFTQNYDLFAAEWPILRELIRLGKTVAVMKWIKDNGIPIDLSFIENYDIEFFSTPTTTPVVSTSGTSGGCTITITGGVTYRPPNEYLADDPVDPATDALRDEALSSRPSENDFLWTFQPSAATQSRFGALKASPVTALAQSFSRRRKDGNVSFREVDLNYPTAGAFRLNLTRFYDSFSDRPEPFGPGWRFLPYELRFPAAEQTFTFGAENQAFDLHARIWLADRFAEREAAYLLIGIDDDDLPLYARSGAGHLLLRLADGSYRLAKLDGSQQLFSADGRLLEARDANDNTLTYTYDGAQRLTRIAASDGRAIDLSYDAQDRIVSALGAGGRQVSYGYDAAGNLSTVTNTAQQTRTYTYDADHNLRLVVDADGDTVFEATYDDYGRAPTRRLSSAANLDVAYDLEQRLTTLTDPFARQITQRFDEQYRLSERVDPLDHVLKVSYNGDFGPETLTDTEGGVTQMFYDQSGQLAIVIDAAGNTSELFYDYRGRLVAIRDPEGLETAYAYDENDNLITVYHTVILQQDENGSLTGFSYDPNNVTSFTYNPDGTLATVTNPLVHTGAFAYEASGLLDTTTSPTGLVTDLGYDSRSRLTSFGLGGSPVAFAYNDADQLIGLTNAAGSVGFSYDANDRLTQLTDAQNNVTNFTYDADGNLTSVEDAALRTTSYAYDALGNLTAVDLPNGTRNEYEYDELGRPIVTFAGVGAPVPDLGVVTDALDFGSVGLGDSATLPLNLYNLASVALTISGVTVSAPFSTDFPGATTIDPGDFLTVNVTFTPTAVGDATADLTITSDDPDDLVHLVALSGVGTVKVLNLTATPAGDGIELGWDPFDPGSGTFLHFNVFRSTSPIGDDVGGLVPIDESLTDSNATSFVDRTAEPGTSYYYAVTPEFTDFAPTAVDAVGPVAHFTAFDVLSPETPLASSASDETRPAVAYNSSDDEYLLVYEKDAGTHLDVLGQRIDADGSSLGSPFNVAASSLTERRPRLAYNSTANNYLVVFEEDFNGDGSNYVVYGQLLTAAGAPSGGAFFVGGFTLHETNPEIAYNSTGNDYLAVWEMDGDVDGKLDVVGQRISAAGTKSGGAFFVGGISVGGTPVVDQNPHLVYNATGDEYLTAFEVDVNGDGSDFDILGVRHSGAGAYLGGPFFLGSTVHAVSGADLQDKNPYVGHDSGNDEYLTLWDVDVAGDGSNWSVASQKTDTTGAPSTLLDGFLVVVDTAAQERNARQVYNPTADEHLLVWEESSAGDPRILARRYSLTDTSLLWGGVLEVASGTANLRQRPDGAFNSASNEMLVAWESDTGSGVDVVGSRLGNVAPVLDVSPTSLDFAAATTGLGLTVSNTGTGHLDWVANGDEPWLSAAPASGSTLTSEVVTVSVDRTGLVPGVYAATLSVSSSGGDTDVPVAMTVPNTPPDAPSSPHPANGAANQQAPDGSLDLTLSWQSADANGDPLTYDLYFGTDAALVAAEDPSVRLHQGLTAASATLSGLDFLTSYAWRVVVFDSRGGSTSGPTWSFVTAAIPAPQLFELLPDPSNLPRPVLAWQAVAGASGYDLQVDDDPSFASPLVDVSGLATTSFTPSSDLPEGELHWRVRSRDGNAQPGPYSAVDAFTADRTPPPVPSLVALVPDPTGDARPLFNWDVVAGAASYRLQIDDEASFATPLVEVTLGATSHEPAASLPEGDVYWRVASRDAAGNQSPYSAADTFTLDLTSPPAATGLAVMRSGGDALLSWSPFPVPPADFDHWNVYRSSSPLTNVSGMVPLTSSLTNAAVTAYTDSTAVPGTGYHYAVTAVDTVGNENKGVVSVLLPSNLAPSTPSAAAPADGAAGVLGATVGLSWQASDPEGSALTYDVYLSTDPAQVAALDVTVRVAQDLTAAAWTAPGLDFLTTYHWRAVAFDALDAGSAGPVWSFTVGVAAPVLDATAPVVPPRPTLTWQAVAGAARYHVEIDDDPGFSSPLVSDDTVTSRSFVPPSPLPDGELHWRVRALDAEGRPGPFSVAGTFTVDSSLQIFADGFESGDVSAWSSAVGGS